jgi:hypothetical protein
MNETIQLYREVLEADFYQLEDDCDADEALT